eukprot:Lankesteria_metandrocarpae@DN4638_c0_g1_i1.p1
MSCCCWCWVYGVVCLLSWAVTTYAFRVFSKADSKRLTAEQRRTYRAFTRLDEGKLKYWQISLISLTILPIRLVVGFATLMGAIASYAVCDVIFGEKCAEHPIGSFITRSFTNVLCRITMFNSGILFRQHLVGSDPKMLTTNTVVSNHVSMTDIPFMAWTLKPAFVAKAGILSVPLVGRAARAFGCVFVNRFNAEDRKQALNALSERQKPGASKNPLLVFPEGTTSNGANVLQFKMGAFRTLAPVTPCVLVYRTPSFHPAYDCLTSSACLWLMNCSLRFTTLDAYWLAPVSAPERLPNETDDDQVKRFAELVRRKVADVLIEKQPENKALLDADDQYEWPGTLVDKCDLMRLYYGEDAVVAGYPTNLKKTE